MKKLILLLTQIDALDKELQEFERLENKTRADILLAAKSDIPLNVAQQKIRDARLTLDLVDAKRAKLLEPHIEAKNQLATLLRHFAEAWNSALQKACQEIELTVLQKNLEFFEGDERACQRWWEQGNMVQMPIFYKYRQAFYPTDSLRAQIGRDLIGTAKHFLRHVARLSREMGIKPSDLE